MLDPNLSLSLPTLRPNPSVPRAAHTLRHDGVANFMPDMRQTLEGISPALALERSERYTPHRAEVTIYHPALGPSAIGTENAIMARALLSPTFVHDSAATRMARVSMMPTMALSRFGRTVDLWA